MQFIRDTVELNQPLASPAYVLAVNSAFWCCCFLVDRTFHIPVLISLASAIICGELLTGWSIWHSSGADSELFSCLSVENVALRGHFIASLQFGYHVGKGLVLWIFDLFYNRTWMIISTVLIFCSVELIEAHHTFKAFIVTYLAKDDSDMEYDGFLPSPDKQAEVEEILRRPVEMQDSDSELEDFVPATASQFIRRAISNTIAQGQDIDNNNSQPTLPSPSRDFVNDFPAEFPSHNDLLDSSEDEDERRYLFTFSPHQQGSNNGSLLASPAPAPTMKSMLKNAFSAIYERTTSTMYSADSEESQESSMNSDVINALGGICVIADNNVGSRDSIAGYWKQNLFLLQESAPKPILVPYLGPCYYQGESVVVSDTIRPPYYGNEFHGLISREETDVLLSENGEGAYLVRESQRAAGAYTLCMRFDGQTRNYKLYFDGQHYVGEKRFDSINDLVADGLIHNYIEKYASEYIKRMADDIIYEESPYSQYQRMQRRMSKRSQQQKRSIDAHIVQPGSMYSNSSIADSYDANSSSPVATTTASTSHYYDSSGNKQFNTIESTRSGGSNGSACSLLDEQKCHKFKLHTWRPGGAWCDYCGNFMWGLVHQGMKCEDCGFAAHRKCSEKTLPDCRPDLKYVKRMFGVELSTLCMAYNCQVPPVVVKCIREIERRGMRLEGLYRIPGFHDEIEHLRVLFDSRGDANLDHVEDVNTVCGLLKLYFRLLPIPLITFSAYKELSDAVSRARNETEKHCEIQRIISDLPVAHYFTLKFISAHLAAVARNAKYNKMTEENLARIFVPTLMRCPNPVHLAFPSFDGYILQYMFINHDKVFVK